MNLIYTENRAGLGQGERHVLDVLSCSGSVVIRAIDLEKELGYTHAMSKLMLSRLTQKGWLQRLKAGIYRIVPLGSESVTPIPDDAWSIAMELFSPCYISGWTAAEHWELTEQVFNSTVVFTSKKQRKKDHLIAGLNYRTKSTCRNDIFGVKKIWSSNTPVLIADQHRTVIDILDYPEIGGGGRHALDIVKEYMKSNEANPELLLQYSDKLGHGAVFKRLGFVAENIMHLPKNFIDKIHLQINSGIILFDPHGPNSGPINSKWGIKINIPLGDIK